VRPTRCRRTYVPAHGDGARDRRRDRLQRAARGARDAPGAVREIVHLSLAEAYKRQEEIGAPLRRSEDARERSGRSSRSDGRCGRGGERRHHGSPVLTELYGRAYCGFGCDDGRGLVLRLTAAT